MSVLPLELECYLLLALAAFSLRVPQKARLDTFAKGCYLKLHFGFECNPSSIVAEEIFEDLHILHVAIFSMAIPSN